MKQNYKFHTSVITSTASKADTEAFDLSIEAFENREYLKSLHLLLDSVDKDIRKQNIKPQGNEFQIPHGAITLYIRQTPVDLHVTAPFVTLSESHPLAMTRQIANINFEDLDLTHLVLKGKELHFEYCCPLSSAHPCKIQHVLKEICTTISQYEYKFLNNLNAQRITKPQFTFYAPETVGYVYQAIQESCRECIDGLPCFEAARQFSEMWDIITTTLLKIVYIAHPKGKLLDFLQNAIYDMNRNLPLALLIADGKQAIQNLQQKSKKEIEQSLYFTPTFFSDKKRSNLQNIRESYEYCYKQVSAWLEAKDYRKVCLKIMYKFYETYYYNQMQEDLNHFLVHALQQSSGQTWEKAAFILYETLETLVQGSLPKEKKRNLIAA